MDLELLLQPMEQVFHRVLSMLLKVHGMWPSEVLDGRRSNKKFSLLLMFYALALFTSVVMNLVHKADSSVYYKGHLYSSLFLLTLLETRFAIVNTRTYERQMYWFYNKIHLSNYKNHNEETTQILRVTETRCYMLFIVLGFGAISGTVTYIAAPVLTNVLNGAFSNSSVELESALYLYIPLEYSHDVTNWSIMCVVFLFTAFFTGIVILLFQIIMIYIILHLAGQIHILMYTLDSIGRVLSGQNDPGQMLSKKEDESAFQILRQSVKHHNFILQSLNLLKDTYGSAMLINYCYDTAACCILLLVLSEDWPLSIIRYGSLVVVVFAQLIGESFAMQYLSNLMEELHAAVCRVPWYPMSKRNKKIVFVMVLVSQQPFVFNAIGLVSVNMNAMASILKTTGSYFIWLKSKG